MESLYYPRYIYMELSRYCNLRCRHCFAEANGDASTIALKDPLISKIFEMNQINKFSIRFGGGEPLLIPYLVELITFCSKERIKSAITTNGILLSDSNLKELLNAGLGELTVSVDGLNNNHDFLRGKGNYERTITKIKDVISKGIPNFSVAFTVTSLNYLEIGSFVAELYSIGVRKFYFFRYCANSNYRILQMNYSQLKKATETIEEAEKRFEDAAFIYEKSSFYPYVINKYIKYDKEGCNFLTNVMSINYNGDVVVCAAIPKVLGNIYTDSLATIYKSIRVEQNRISFLPEECSLCEFNKYCHGGCKSDSYRICGNYLNRDSNCFKCEILEEKNNRNK